MFVVHSGYLIAHQSASQCQFDLRRSRRIGQLLTFTEAVAGATPGGVEDVHLKTLCVGTLNIADAFFCAGRKIFLSRDEFRHSSSHVQVSGKAQ